jgi:hypothetical protein
MTRATLAALSAVVLSTCGGPALAGEKVAPELTRALIVEWTFANCPDLNINPALVALAAMMLNGRADRAEVTRAREAIREGFNANYPSIKAGCADMAKRIPK